MVYGNDISFSSERERVQSSASEQQVVVIISEEEGDRLKKKLRQLFTNFI